MALKTAWCVRLNLDSRKAPLEAPLCWCNLLFLVKNCLEVFEFACFCKHTLFGTSRTNGINSLLQLLINCLSSRSIKEHTYLAWEFNHDQEGGCPRARPFHCTLVRLTSVRFPNVKYSEAEFMSVGFCVRAKTSFERIWYALIILACYF